MNCQADIIKIANERLVDADYLYLYGRYDGAYYMAGYAIELLLKARVCKTLDIDNFFDDRIMKQIKYPKTFKNHDIDQLLILSGLYKKWTQVLSKPKYIKAWSKVGEWNETSRYLTGKTALEVQKFLSSVRIIEKWIKKHL